MWFKEKFFKITVGLALILLIIYLVLLINPIFLFLLNLAKVIFFPTIIAGVLYYILRPFCQILEKKKIPRILSISIIYLLFLGLMIFAMTYIWPYVSEQINEFTSTPKEKLKEFENKTVDIMNLFNFTSIPNEKLRENLFYYLQEGLKLITDNLVFTLSSIATIASYFIITPFILFYFLKDDQYMSSAMTNYVPRKYKKLSKVILTDIDFALSGYISGQIMVAFIVGILIFIGYWIIGLKYAFLLAIIAFIFNLIPFTGPIISTIPAMVIGLAESPLMGIKVLCIVALVHLLDLNLISPRIVGPRLKIHPITIILLLVASISIWGFIGLFLIVPLYAVIKVIIIDLYREKYIKNEELD